MKKVLAILLTMVLLVMVVPTNILVSAATYNSAAAVNYANLHWNDGVGKCATFVSNCLSAGGCSAWSSLVVNLRNQLISGGWGTEYLLTENGQSIYEYQNSGKLSAGDPIFFYCKKCGTFPHVVICTGFNSAGKATASGHNAAWNNVTYIAGFWDASGHKGDDILVYSFHMTHTHSYNTYVYYWKDHPHYKCYQCSCGDVKENTAEPTYIETCETCNPKPCEHSYDNLCDTTCNLCGEYRSPNHMWSWVTDKEATCGTTGVQHLECARCNAKKSEGTIISATGKHVWKNGTCSVCKKTSTPVKITFQPKTAYASYGNYAKITVGAKGDGLTYNWYVKDVGDKKYYKSSIKGNSYSQKLTDKTNGRRVLCIVTDKYGNKVQSKTVLMRMKATITTQPKTVYASYGNYAKITVGAKGDGLTYNWYVKDAGDKKYYKSSIKGSSYSQKVTNATNGRRVLCIVTDKYGNKVQSKTVLMRMKATITSQPKSVTVANGKIAKIKVGAKGDGLKYTWYIKSAKGTKYYKSSIKTNTYSVKMTSAVNGRKVLCYVTDKYGNKVQTRTVILKKK